MFSRSFIHFLSSLSRRYPCGTIINNRCYKTSNFDSFQRIKILYEEGKIADAMIEYLKRPNPVSASFLVTKQDNVDIALKLYQVAKYNNSVSLQLIIKSIHYFQKRNARDVIQKFLLDDFMKEMSHIIPKDITKISALTWKMIIFNLCRSDRKRDIMTLMNIMGTYHIKLDSAIYTSLLNICTDKKWLDLGEVIHNFIKQNVEMNIILKTCLISMYGKCRSLEQAIEIFNGIEISERNVVTWTAMISAYCDNEKFEEAFELFSQMQKEGVQLDRRTITSILNAYCRYNLIENAAEMLFSMEHKIGIKPSEYHYSCILSACAEKRLLSLGKKIHHHIMENNCPQNIFLKNTLINMYGRCGSLEKAIEIFKSIEVSETDIHTWNVMISAFAVNGKGKEALNLFEQMQREGRQPDEITMIHILNAYNNLGLVQEALDIFYNLESKFKTKPNAKHCNIIVYGLSRVGRLQDAEDFIDNYMRKYGIESIIVPWLTLLDACHKYMDLVRAEKVSQIIINLDPTNKTVYDILSNIYAKTGNAAKIDELQKVMDKKGIKKDSAVPKAEVSVPIYNSTSEDALHLDRKSINRH